MTNKKFTMEEYNKILKEDLLKYDDKNVTHEFDDGIGLMCSIFYSNKTFVLKKNNVKHSVLDLPSIINFKDEKLTSAYWYNSDSPSRTSGPSKIYIVNNIKYTIYTFQLMSINYEKNIYMLLML